MNNLLIPDYRFARLSSLTPDWLRQHGYQALLLDLDNTFLRRYREQVPPDQIHWVRLLRQHGIAVVFVSNSGGGRLRHVREVTGCPAVSWALKPWGRAFRKALALLPPDTPALVVGDQLFTDVLGAHLAGLPAALVASLGSPARAQQRWPRQRDGEERTVPHGKPAVSVGIVGEKDREKAGIS